MAPKDGIARLGVASRQAFCIAVGTSLLISGACPSTLFISPETQTP